jgi:hypothetical protein
MEAPEGIQHHEATQTTSHLQALGALEHTLTIDRENSTSCTSASLRRACGLDQVCARFAHCRPSLNEDTVAREDD